MPPSTPVGRYPSESLLHDSADRKIKARKILAVLAEALGEDLSDAVGMEVGCAAGLITRALAPHFGAMLGLEYDTWHVQQMGGNATPGLLLVRGDAQRLPVPDACLDVVVCAQVYEHVADAQRLADEIHRVLRPGGVCFFSGPNRLDPIERHYGLPFVSWLPRRLADVAMRLAGHPQGYTEHPFTYWRLCRLWEQFEIVDFTVAMIKHPTRYALPAGRLMLWANLAPEWLLRLARPLYPNYNWLLIKNKE